MKASLMSFILSFLLLEQIKVIWIEDIKLNVLLKKTDP